MPINQKIAAEIAREIGIDCVEVTEEVFESALSNVCEVAENQIRTIRALPAATYGT